jgi:maltokinase
VNPEQISIPISTPISRAIKDFMADARWFAGKDRDFEVTGVRRLAEVPGPAGPGRVLVNLVEVTYGPGDVEIYQVPLAYYPEPEHRLDHAFVGWWEEPDVGWVHAYDAVHDREAMSAWLRAFAAADETTFGEARTGEGLQFRRLPGHELDAEAHSALFSGEQSNSSVFFGEDAILKVFRRVTPGINPDIEIHALLTEADSDHVAALYGWVEYADGDTYHLGMLQQFLRTATDGWDLALASVRNLFAEADLHANEVGGDFAAESARLGEALRDIHEALATVLPTDTTVTPAEIASGMAERLDAALPVVPELAERADGLRRLYRALGELDEVHVQRIHGDLHLGQTLRTALGWKVVDFEGEPAKPLSERVQPDSRWRDVAGMLRSFDYAPHAVERMQDHTDGSEQRAYRAQEWAHRNQNHFLVAYAGGELTPQQHTLLDAYVADKAVYECVYETRNRPAWLAIPLAAVARIGAEA